MWLQTRVRFAGMDTAVERVRLDAASPWEGGGFVTPSVWDVSTPGQTMYFEALLAVLKPDGGYALYGRLHRAVR